MRYFVLPYKQGSKSARSLAQALGGRVLRLVGSTYVPRPTDVVINWGSTGITSHNVTLNYPDIVRNASNKLKFFRAMTEQGLSPIIPEFWTSPDDIPDTAFPVVCRTILAGHSGAGIHLSHSRDELVLAPLYVKYVKKQDEYRVHVGIRRSGEHYDGTPDHETSIIAVQRKARRHDHPNPNWLVRNHANGFVYARQSVTPPPAILDVARRALEASGLDFGAVDVIWNAQQERAFCLEINTAPGLEGQTVEDYANFFQGM